MSKGVLYLIPAVLGENTAHTIPSYVVEQIDHIRHFIVEQPKTARRFLRSIGYQHNFDQGEMYELNKQTNPADTYYFLDRAKEGLDMGLLSEAGCPGVADPGAGIVGLAHALGIKVVPLIGPSSILLALMGSGFNGQSFVFHGYLPIDKKERQRKLRALEKTAQNEHQTQIFIEAPYRNNQMLATMFASCSGDTKLCIASMLTTNEEFILTKPLSYWKQHPPELHKKPTVFVIG